MSVKQRINAIEKKAVLDSEVQIRLRHTIYEAKDGGIDSEFFTATICNPKQSETFLTLSSADGETKEIFKARAEAECLAAFGSLPRDWPETCA